MDKGVSLGDAVKLAIDVKVASNKRPATLKKLRELMRRFSQGREDAPATEVLTSKNIELFLSRFTNTKTRSGHLGYISMACGVLFRKRIITENPCKFIEPVSQDLNPPKILTVAQAKRLLESARYTGYLAYIVLGLLGGLRPSEAARVTFEDIDLAQGRVMVSSHSKVRRWRIVQLKPSAIAWLRYAVKHGSQLPMTRGPIRRANKVTASAIGIRSLSESQDVLRHSAASYWIASVQDAGRVSFEMGNSVTVLLKHYRRIVTVEEAQAFWSIYPPTDDPQLELRLI